MATSNGAAPASGDTQKLGLLNAMAQAGAAGAAAQQQGQQANVQAGQAAASSALAEPGAQPGTDFGNSLAARAASPNLAAAEGIGRTEQAQSIYNQGMNTGMGSYYDALHQASGVQAAATAQDIGATNARAETAAAKNRTSPRDVIEYDAQGSPQHVTRNMTEAEYNAYQSDQSAANRTAGVNRRAAGGADALDPAGQMVHAAFQKNWDPGSNALVDESMKGAKDVAGAISNSFVSQRLEEVNIQKAQAAAKTSPNTPIPVAHDWAAIRNALKQIYSGQADRTKMPAGSLEPDVNDRKESARQAALAKKGARPTTAAAAPGRPRGPSQGMPDLVQGAENLVGRALRGDPKAKKIPGLIQRGDQLRHFIFG